MTTKDTTDRKEAAMATTSTSVEVGAFTYDTASGVLTGPAAYMGSDQYASLIARVKAGADPCGAFTFSPDPVTALLVTIQTDYAGWKGAQDFARRLGR